MSLSFFAIFLDFLHLSVSIHVINEEIFVSSVVAFSFHIYHRLEIISQFAGCFIIKIKCTYPSGTPGMCFLLSKLLIFRRFRCDVSAFNIIHLTTMKKRFQLMSISSIEIQISVILTELELILQKKMLTYNYLTTLCTILSLEPTQFMLLKDLTE